MELSERKKKILQAIVEDYITTAEPVGSSYVLNSHNLGVSSATVRNEMAALEESGYLEKPHTSAGRIPSALGYRVYVNELMNKYQLSINEVNQIKLLLERKYMEMNKAMSGISELMSMLTHYTTVLTQPTLNSVVVSSIKLMCVDSGTVVMIVVTNGGDVKSSSIITGRQYDTGVIERLSNLLNSKYMGVDLSTLDESSFEYDMKTIPVEDSLLEPIFGFLKSIASENKDPNIELVGTSNIFNYPEFNDIEKAKGFFEFIKKDSGLKKLIADSGDDVSVIIGSENPVLKEHGLSLVVSNYTLGTNLKGKLAIIGPTRMDYSKVISTLDYLTNALNGMLPADELLGDGIRGMIEE